MSEEDAPRTLPEAPQTYPVDPTANVIALVEANRVHQTSIDEWIIKYAEAKLDHAKELMAAERRRVDDLAAMKQGFDKQISETQTTQLKTTSDLVSATQSKMEGALSETINKAGETTKALLESLDKRMAAVEQFRYETGGAQGRQGINSSFIFSVLGVLGVLGLIITDLLKR